MRPPEFHFDYVRVKIKLKMPEEHLDTLAHMLFFWETNPVRIGKIIRFIHNVGMIALFVVFVIVQTVFPSFVMLFVVWLLLVAICAQHIVFGGCVVSKLEQRLIGDSSSFIDPLLELFNIPISPESTAGIVTLGSSTMVVLVGFQLVSRVSLMCWTRSLHW